MWWCCMWWWSLFGIWPYSSHFMASEKVLVVVVVVMEVLVVSGHIPPTLWHLKKLVLVVVTVVEVIIGLVVLNVVAVSLR